MRLILLLAVLFSANAWNPETARRRLGKTDASQTKPYPDGRDPLAYGLNGNAPPALKTYRKRVRDTDFAGKTREERNTTLLTLAGEVLVAEEIEDNTENRAKLKKLADDAGAAGGSIFKKMYDYSKKFTKTEKKRIANKKFGDDKVVFLREFNNIVAEADRTDDYDVARGRTDEARMEKRRIKNGQKSDKEKVEKMWGKKVGDQKRLLKQRNRDVKKFKSDNGFKGIDKLYKQQLAEAKKLEITLRANQKKIPNVCDRARRDLNDLIAHDYPDTGKTGRTQDQLRTQYNAFFVSLLEKSKLPDLSNDSNGIQCAPAKINEYVRSTTSRAAEIKRDAGTVRAAAQSVWRDERVDGTRRGQRKGERVDELQQLARDAKSDLDTFKDRMAGELARLKENESAGLTAIDRQLAVLHVPSKKKANNYAKNKVTRRHFDGKKVKKAP